MRNIVSVKIMLSKFKYSNKKSRPLLHLQVINFYEIIPPLPPQMTMVFLTGFCILSIIQKVKMS